MLEHLCLYLLFFILPYENLCCVFTTRTHDLSLFFMPLQKARRETLATLTTLKEVTSSMAFATESGSQNFIIFLSKIETTIIGTKAVLCVCVCACARAPLLISWTLTSAGLPDGRLWPLGFNPCFYQHNFPAWEVTPKGLAIRAVPKGAFMVCLSCHFWSRGGSGASWQ